jgi:hypothetical protein
MARRRAGRVAAKVADGSTSPLSWVAVVVMAGG